MKIHFALFIATVASYVQAKNLRSRALAVPTVHTASNFDDGWEDYEEYDGGSVSNGLPALQQFLFNKQGNEELLRQISVLPDEAGVAVGFQDDDGSTDYHWEVKVTDLPNGTYYSTFRSSSQGVRRCETVVELLSDPEFFPVLLSFNLEFINGATRVDQMKVRVKEAFVGREIRPSLEVCLNDDGKDDPFTFTVGYAMVPIEYLFRTNNPEHDTGKRYDAGGFSRRFIGREDGYTPILTGFEFDFRDNEQNLDKIGVDLSNGGYADVYFQGNSHSVGYDWRVWYAFVSV